MRGAVPPLPIRIYGLVLRHRDNLTSILPLFIYYSFIFFVTKIVQFSLQYSLKKVCIFRFSKCSKWPPSAWITILTLSTMKSVALRRTAASLTRLAHHRKFAKIFHLLCPLLFIHHFSHVTPHMEINRTEIRWQRWPILVTTTADPSSVNSSFTYSVTSLVKCRVCPVMLVVHL